MPIIDLQRRLARTGAIRLGNRVPKVDRDGNPVLDRRGNPVTYPNKLDTFRVTSPHRDVADAVARLFGGTVLPWQGARGPEFEVITTRAELPVLVPAQMIDPNLEFWGRNLKMRHCDGKTERIKGTPCLCQQWNNHDHKYWDGRCQLCGVSERWQGQPHTHQFDHQGECETCGCTRICKPTTRVNVMIPGVPGIGVFKVESHGINAASELPTLADMIAATPVPLPAHLGMRPEERIRMTRSGEIETRHFYVPELRFTWATPELIFADSMRLEQAARSSIAATPVFQALTATPPAPDPDSDEEHLTREEIIKLITTSKSMAAIRALWKDAFAAGFRDAEMERLLTDQANHIMSLEATEKTSKSETETIDEESTTGGPGPVRP